MIETDLELIKKSKNGDFDAFNKLIKEYQNMVYNICFSFGKNKENALDISQEVFLKVYQNMSRLKQIQAFKSWIIRIAYNESINWQRRNKMINRQTSLQDHHEMTVKTISNEDEFLAKEHKSELIRSLYNLNTRYRLAVVLRYFEDMPIKEIANTLQCSEGVVKNMLFRSLRKLKDSLQTEKNLDQ